jgi:predicted aspartyl protease
MLRAKLKLAGLLVLAGVAASSGAARAGNCQAVSDLDCDDKPPQRIALRIYRDFLVVAKGQIGSVPESQNFILDTGTAPSILNARLLGQLGLATIPSTFRAFGKTAPAQSTMIPEIELGPIRAVSLPVQVQNLARLEADLGIPIAGIIGMDVLSKSSFRLDYDKSEMRFGDVPQVGIPVRFDARAGLAVAEARIEGNKARILVDTGSDRIVLFGGNFREVRWLGLRNTSQSGSNLVDQNIYVQVFPATDIVLGGQHFRDNRAYFVPGSTDPEFDGLLGVRALGFRALSYDAASGTLFLQK